MSHVIKNCSFPCHTIDFTYDLDLVTKVKFTILNCYVRDRAKVLTGFRPRALNFKIYANDS